MWQLNDLANNPEPGKIRPMGFFISTKLAHMEMRIACDNSSGEFMYLDCEILCEGFYESLMRTAFYSRRRIVIEIKNI